jgi:hypothetical protein
MTKEHFLSALASEVPETQPIVREHLKDHDELLLHLLTADLRRYAIEAFRSGRSEELQRLLELIDRALVNGTEAVINAVAVSFVEDTGWWDPTMESFIATWPKGLREEARRQQDWRPS